jgi:hypothetical protein
MKKFIFMCIMALFASTPFTLAQTALVIIAHGAPDKQWNMPVLSLEDEVRNELNQRGLKEFTYVRVALMEFSQPSVASVIADCKRQNIKQIYVLPLFIAPSSHSEEDIPNVLNIKYNHETRCSLKEEKTDIADTDIHITVGPTLSYSDVIEDIISDRVKGMSKNPSCESLVLMAHGDPDYRPFWEKLLKHTGEVAEKRTGVKFSGFAFIGMGQNFYHDFLPIATEAAKDKKSILVQGVYLSGGVKDIATYALKDKAQEQYADSLPKGISVVYDEQGLLPDSRISKWIADRAAEWVTNK